MGRRAQRDRGLLRITRMPVPRLLLGLLGALLVLTGVVELLVNGVMWLYLVHLLSGLVALAATPWRRLVKPTLLLIGALYVVLYILESADPTATGDPPDPTNNPSLITTGIVLVLVMVGFMWPWTRPAGRPANRRSTPPDR